MCLFVFKVLPQFDVIRALFLMNATCVLPALMKLLLTKGDRGPMSVIMDIVALAMQCSVFFFMTRYMYIYITTSAVQLWCEVSRDLTRAVDLLYA